MSSTHGPLHGHELSEAAIDRLLKEVGVGVLSMASKGTPYGLPLSFGYDGSDRLYFVFFGHSETGRKVTFAERTPEASFLVYDIESEEAWRSAIISGNIDRIGPDEWENAREAMAANAFRPQLLTDTDLQEDPRVWRLRAAEKSGRTVGWD